MDISINDQLELLIFNDEVYSSLIHGDLSCINSKFLKNIEKNHDIKDIIKAAERCVSNSVKPINATGYLWMANLEMRCKSSYLRSEIISGLSYDSFNNSTFAPKYSEDILEYVFYILNNIKDDERLALLKGGKDLEDQILIFNGYLSDIAAIFNSKSNNTLFITDDNNASFLSHLSALIDNDPKLAMRFVNILYDGKKQDIYTSNIENNLAEVSKDLYLKGKSLFFLEQFLMKNNHDKDPLLVFDTLDKISNLDDPSFHKEINRLYIRASNHHAKDKSGQGIIIKDILAIQQFIRNKASSPKLITTCIPSSKVLAAIMLSYSEDPAISNDFGNSVDLFNDIIKLFSKDKRDDFISDILSNVFIHLTQHSFDQSIYLLEHVLRSPHLQSQLKSSKRLSLSVGEIANTINWELSLKKNITSSTMKSFLDFLLDNISQNHEIFGALQALSLSLDIDADFKFNQSSLAFPKNSKLDGDLYKGNEKHEGYKKIQKRFVQYVETMRSKIEISKSLENVKNNKEEYGLKRKI